MSDICIGLPTAFPWASPCEAAHQSAPGGWTFTHGPLLCSARMHHMWLNLCGPTPCSFICTIFFFFWTSVVSIRMTMSHWVRVASLGSVFGIIGVSSFQLQITALKIKTSSLISHFILFLMIIVFHNKLDFSLIRPFVCLSLFFGCSY